MFRAFNLMYPILSFILFLCVIVSSACSSGNNSEGQLTQMVSACNGDHRERTADVWQEALSGSNLPALQLNLSPPDQRTWITVNALRSCKMFLEKNDGSAFTSKEAQTVAAGLAIREGGWPQGLPADVQMYAVPAYATAANTSSTSTISNQNYLYGVYVLTWEGTGVVSLGTTRNDGIDYEIIRTEPQRIVLVIRTPERGPVVKVLSSEPADPIHNMNLWPPVSDGAGIVDPIFRTIV